MNNEGRGGREFWERSLIKNCIAAREGSGREGSFPRISNESLFPCIEELTVYRQTDRVNCGGASLLKILMGIMLET